MSGDALTHKIIFAGTMGAGKTTAIGAISEIDPIVTDAQNNDKEQHQKATTTVAMDYGKVTLEDGSILALYGTPGQERFDFMWPIISKGALGLIILINNHHNAPLKALANYIDRFSELIKTAGAVVGVTCTDLCNSPSITEYRDFLKQRSLVMPVFSVDVRKKDDVLLLLNAVISISELKEA